MTKPVSILRLLFISLVCLPSVAIADEAKDEVPCIIFSGRSETNGYYDLEKYNRIYLGEDSFILSSTTDESLEDIELLYSLFNHVEFNDAIPTDGDITGIEMADADGNGLYYSHNDCSLRVVGNPENEFLVGIFDMNGKLILSRRLKGGETVNLRGVQSGIYGAVAKSADASMSLKFIIR